MSAFFNMPAVEKLLEDKGLAQVEVSALRELVQLEWVHFDWSGRLEAPSPVKRCVIGEIEGTLRSMLDIVESELPATARHVRGSITQPKLISSIGYYVCEIQSYSLSTLRCLRDGLQRQLGDHVNPVLDTYVNAVLIQRVLEA